MLLSFVVTVRNEERHMADLLDSLVTQEPPIEVVVVDANSEDRTREIVLAYSQRYPFVRLHVRGGTRGRGRNYGVAQASGSAVAFIDGDCIANPFWAAKLRARLREADVVAGRMIHIGNPSFENLERVELLYKGIDITYPSSNLAYRRDLFVRIGGFDEWFLTAEDIDLNLRAVAAGARLVHEPQAIVYHRTRTRLYDFYRQALWNGAGRKQLTLKHGRLWGLYRPVEMLRRQRDVWSMTRLAAAMLGYAGYKVFGKRPPQ